MRKLLFALFALGTLFPLTISAQYDSLAVEVVTYHDGMVGSNYDLTGYVTYKVYVVSQNADDFLTNLPATDGGTQGCDNLTPQNCFTDIPLVLSTTGNFFKEAAFGAFLGCDQQTVLCDPNIEPALCFSTFLTIGMESNLDDGNCQPLDTGTGAADFCDLAPFGANYLEISNGGVFTTLDVAANPNGLFDLPGNKNLIAQITTNGDWSMDFATQIIINGIPGGDFELSLHHLDNPCMLVNLTAEISDPTCFGYDDGTIQVDAGTPDFGPYGCGEHSFDLYDGGFTFLESNQTGFFDELLAGDYNCIFTSKEGCIDTIAVQLVDPELLELTATLEQDNLCFEEFIADIDASATGGTGQVDITFEQGGTLLDLPLVFEGGLYDVIATDAEGCADTVQVDVASISAFTVDITPTELTCFGECSGGLSTSVGGGEGTVSYLWQFCDGSTSTLPALSDLCPCEDYELTVTDANMCTAEAAYGLASPPELVLDLSTTNNTCADANDGTIVPEVSGGTPNAADPLYEITTDPVLPDLDNVPGGLYTVFVTDANDCVVSEEVEILNPDPITFDITVTDITCGGVPEGVISVANVQGGYGTVNVSLNAGTEGPDGTFTQLFGGDYLLTFIDPDGICQIDSVVTVIEPDPLVIDSLQVSNLLCFEDMSGSLGIFSSGGTAPFTYTFGAQSQVDDNLFANQGDSGGEQIVTITDVNNCFTESVATITQPELLLIDITEFANLNCGGECSGSAFFEATGGTLPYASLVWNGTPDQVNDELCAGVNTIVVTDNNGCTASDEVLISEPDPILIVAEIDSVTCTGMQDGAMQILVDGGTGPLTLASFDLDLDDLGENLYESTDLFEGDYVVIATDSAGCFLSDTLTVGADVITDFDFTISMSPVTCFGEGDGTATAGIVGGQEPYQIQWDDPVSQTTTTAIGLLEGIYNVVVSYEEDNGVFCVLSDFVIVEPTEECLLITNAITPNGDGDNDVWIIGGLEYYPESEVQVFNRWGQLLFESVGYQTPWDGTFNNNRLPVADYYYVIKYDLNREPLVGTVTVKY